MSFLKRKLLGRQFSHYKLSFVSEFEKRELFYYRGWKEEKKPTMANLFTNILLWWKIQLSALC